jgi:hypothetical protein
LVAGAQPHRGGSLLEDKRHLLGRAGARTREALVEAISEAISKVRAEDARGFFGDCGYTIQWFNIYEKRC